MCKRQYLFESHTADIKMHAFGTTRKELLTNALIGMFHVFEPRLATGHTFDQISCATATHHHKVHVQSTAFDLLLVDFLSYALYLSDVNNQVYTDAHITIATDTQIQAVICGESIIGCDGPEVKAVTYHDLCCIFEQNEWHAIIVFDI